jgi:hypothetical protein
MKYSKAAMAIAEPTIGFPKLIMVKFAVTARWVTEIIAFPIGQRSLISSKS